VLIKPEKNPEQTESGLWLSEHGKPEQTGTVVAVGPCEHPRLAEVEAFLKKFDYEFDDMEEALVRSLVRPAPLVKVGDYVVFSWASGQEIHVDDEKYLLMRESDILCVLDPEPEIEAVPV
jgi:co-chaperonin GroES (HSP10)